MNNIRNGKVPDRLAVALTTCALLSGYIIGTPSESYAGESRGAFLTGEYRNLFVEAGRSPQEVTDRIGTAFRQLFHGDAKSEAIYFQAGTNAAGPLAYIYDVHSRDVRSEGMSYGMMIAVQLDRKAEFDALWNWAHTYMYHPSPASPAYEYFSW